MKCLCSLYFCMAVCVYIIQCEDYFQPEQIHLSYGTTPDELVITWVTLSEVKDSVVEYGLMEMDTIAKGTMDVFVDGGSLHRSIYMHRVVLKNLAPKTRYVYHVGSNLGWSDLFTFVTQDPGQDWGPRFAVFGDMGNKNAQSLARLQEETQRGHFDAILHIGDFAYNMDDDNASVGDAFMNQVQSVAAYIPYMTCVGNHENAYNFSNYKSRFTMPKAGGDGQNMFYSFDIGPAHIVMFSSEFYYYINYGMEQIAVQYEWLENDLKRANEASNRAERPWLITMCHRPLYCSNSNDKEHCINKENLIRVGKPENHRYGIEDLLYKYGVDLHVQAHEHSYERLWPVYNLTVCNGSTEHPYTNPKAPVHIVTGSAGCQEGVDPFFPQPFAWSAFHSDDYGYTRMNVMNKTHLYMEQISDDKDGKVIDTVTIIKDKHGPAAFNCH